MRSVLSVGYAILTRLTTLRGTAFADHRVALLFLTAFAALVIPTSALATLVYYWRNYTNPLTAYTNNVLGYKYYNEMYAGAAGNCTWPVGIYLLTSGGSKIRVLNGCGYVYLSFPQEYSRAYCWNRSTSFGFYADCDYQRP